MQVDYLVLADAAAAVDGKHYIHGGGWDTIFATSFPVAHPILGVAVRLRVPWMETNQPQELLVDVIDGDGNSLYPEPPIRGNINVGRPPNIPPGGDQVVPLAFNLAGLTFQGTGDYVVVCKLNGIDVARAPFRVASVQGGITV